MAMTVNDYLKETGVSYELVDHPRRVVSSEIAQSAHIAGGKLAKGVVLHEEGGGYILVVVPSTHRVDLRVLSETLSESLGLATEGEIETLFPDCDRGAVPPIGPAYGLRVLLDRDLAGQDDVYFEAGDHTALVHVSGDDFGRLLSEAQQGAFGYQA
jgi:Ala-tRNA(Pro) deacylase